MNDRRHHQAGYTLLEIMIVIFILGVLGALLIQAIPFLQQKARDNRRQFEVASLQRVIETYRSDTGNFPSETDGGGAYYSFMTENDALASGYSPNRITAAYIPNLVPTYFHALPKDPLPGSSSIPGCNALGFNRSIAYFSNGEYYKLVYHCASETGDYSTESRFYDPARPGWAWSVSNDMEYTTFVLGW
jgi:prepilin-type N-terminal cleavage/methylation domain-containing protein